MVTLNRTLRELPSEDKTEVSKEETSKKGHRRRFESSKEETWESY